MLCPNPMKRSLFKMFICGDVLNNLRRSDLRLFISLTDRFSTIFTKQRFTGVLGLARVKHADMRIVHCQNSPKAGLFHVPK